MTALDEIHKIYDSLPTIDCKGLCWNSCGPIDMSDAERARTVELGANIQVFTEERSQAWARDERLYCSALSFNTQGGRIGCSIYEDRPLICRIWGLSEGDLACPNGCEPTRRMPPEEVFELLMKSYKIGGHGGDLADGEAAIAELMDDPELRPLLTRFLQGDRSVENALRDAVLARRP